jgi:Protein of unknown function (DUF1566)
MKRREVFGIFACFELLFFAVCAFAAPVPDTGQTKCYDVEGSAITCPSPGQPLYGQDANYNINPMSYTKLDGSGNPLPDSATSWVTVKDNVTGLVWETKTNQDGKTDYNNPHDADNTYTWFDNNPATNGGYSGPLNEWNTEGFIRALNAANYGGYSDWRLPTVKELSKIANFSISPYAGKPAINAGYFLNTAASWYWSSTASSSNTKNAWFVDFSYGSDFIFDKDVACYARAVRGGKSGALGYSVIGSFDTMGSGLSDDVSTAIGGYADNGDGTVTDTSSGLMWQQKAGSSTQTWEQALAYCEGLNLGGHTDWRLPTIKELGSLVDYSRYNPAINTTYFPNEAASWYWSSTTLASGYGYAWIVDFNYGYDSNNRKTDSNYVRSVRGGQSGVPIVTVLANKYSQSIAITNNTPLSVTVALDPGSLSGQNADWWIAASTPWGLYTLTPSGWSPGINMLVQYPLLNIASVEVFNGYIPVGDYTFYLAVDMSPDGILDEPIYYDGVQVHVTQ